MATLTVSSQAAEAILSRARRLSSNAFERVHPTSFAEGEDNRTSNNGLLDPIAHRRSFSQRTSVSRISTSSANNDTLPSSAQTTATTTTATTTTTTTTAAASTTTTTTTTDPLVVVQSPQELTIENDINNKDSTFPEPRSHTLPCASTGLTPGPSRPRALTLEAIHEGLSPPSSPGQNKGEDAHRKHRSEDGGGLVRGILVAFRQQIALDSPTSDCKLDTEFAVTEPSLANTEYLVVSAPEPEPNPSSSPSPEVKDVTAEEISPREPEESTRAVAMDSALMLMDETTEEEGSTTCDISDTRETGEDDDDSETSESDEPAEPLSAESPARAPPIISSTSASSATDIYHDAKAAFLTKMGRRKNSFSEGHDADASSIKSNSTNLSSTSSTNPKLSKKRSSKLFGKLVPKFLQTSFSPTLSTSSTSPRSQTASLSPLSTRSSRSGSMGGHSSCGKADDGSVKSAGSSPALRTGSQESLPRRSGLDLEQCSPGVDEPTCPEYLECLRAEMDGGPSILSARRSSCSSNTSRRSSRSNGSKPSGSPITSLDAEMDVAKNGQGRFTFEVEYGEDEEEEGEEDDEDESDKDGQSADSKIDDSRLSAEYASMDPPLSPYIIDENCDDNFFLNSVLRKKSLPTSPALAHANCSSEPVMYCSYPSNTTISTVNSVATTPSLSGWSNNSSQASTPSPTSPSANGQVYPFPVTGATTTKGSQPYQYRSNPLPPPINELVDEKRSRLRDAVGEWRRAANQSG